jgi:hypothetical protein
MLHNQMRFIFKENDYITYLHWLWTESEPNVCLTDFLMCKQFNGRALGEGSMAIPWMFDRRGMGSIHLDAGNVHVIPCRQNLSLLFLEIQFGCRFLSWLKSGKDITWIGEPEFGITVGWSVLPMLATVQSLPMLLLSEHSRPKARVKDGVAIYQAS